VCVVRLLQGLYFQRVGIGEYHAKQKLVSKIYYIFQTDEDGTIVAVDKVIGLNQVNERLTKFTPLRPGKYLIYDPTESRFVEPFEKSA
jgi:hypothetical protein